METHNSLITKSTLHTTPYPTTHTLYPTTQTLFTPQHRYSLYPTTQTHSLPHNTDTRLTPQHKHTLYSTTQTYYLYPTTQTHCSLLHKTDTNSSLPYNRHTAPHPHPTIQSPSPHHFSPQHTHHFAPPITVPQHRHLPEAWETAVCLLLWQPTAASQPPPPDI
ncbi:hypothetical protein BsWGS_25046 [Bradybaena similaris]